MSIESTADWDGLRAVSAVAGRTLDVLVSHVRAGVSTAHLDALAAGVLKASGARPAPTLVYGFPGTVLISVNDEVGTRHSGHPRHRRRRSRERGRHDRTGRSRRRCGQKPRRGAWQQHGQTIHEPPSVPNRWDPRQQNVLKEGLVLTIEPMVTVGSGRPC